MLGSIMVPTDEVREDKDRNFLYIRFYIVYETNSTMKVTGITF